MEPRALLRNSIFLVFLMVIFQGCRDIDARASLNFDVDKTNAQSRNGVMFRDGKPYNGHLYKLNENRTDSLFSAFYKDGLQDGPALKWYENGQLMEKRNFHKNSKTGVHLGFWPNGNRRFCYTFADGVYEGTQFEWFESGKLYRKKAYKNGQEQGLQQEWTENGALLVNYESIDGRQYGNIGKKHCASVWREDVYAKPAK